MEFWLEERSKEFGDDGCLLFGSSLCSQREERIKRLCLRVLQIWATVTLCILASLHAHRLPSATAAPNHIACLISGSSPSIKSHLLPPSFLFMGHRPTPFQDLSRLLLASTHSSFPILTILHLSHILTPNKFMKLV